LNPASEVLLDSGKSLWLYLAKSTNESRFGNNGDTSNAYNTSYAQTRGVKVRTRLVNEFIEAFDVLTYLLATGL